MKVRLIGNPSAGGGKLPEILSELNDKLRAWIGIFDIILTSAAGDARRAARDAAREGYDTLLIAGGDGTLNEVINGVAEIPGAIARATFAVIPIGTGNDFATTLGMPPDPLETAQNLSSAKKRSVDLAILNDHHFVNASIGGNVAAASGSLSPEVKAAAGKLAYVLGGIQALVDGQEIEVTVQSSGGNGPDLRRMSVQMFAICNGPTAGGRKLVAPLAKIDDGSLDALFVGAAPIHESLTIAKDILRGDLIEDPRVLRFRASSIELSFTAPADVNTDGELRKETSCSYRVQPGATNFLSLPATPRVIPNA